MLAWKKLSSAKFEDAWMERLNFIDPTRVVITSIAGSKSIRVEAYALSAKEGRLLTGHFGGTLFTVNSKQLSGQQSERPPIRIRKELLVVGSDKQRTKAIKEFPQRKVVLVPAAMAFGTGDHATTSSCLRLLCDVSSQLERWNMLDLGTGTAILAIAARMLGAAKVEATDFDPQALKTAKENLRLNQIKGVTLKRSDLLRWQPEKQYDVVAANVFSSILVEAAPAISRAAGRWLILSGILRVQEGEVLRAFKQQLEPVKIVRKGKWVTMLLRRK